jgi:hypothetical protein
LAQITGLTILEEPAIDSIGVKNLPARLASEMQVVPVLVAGAEEGRLNLISPLPRIATLSIGLALFQLADLNGS